MKPFVARPPPLGPSKQQPRQVPDAGLLKHVLLYNTALLAHHTYGTERTAVAFTSTIVRVSLGQSLVLRGPPYISSYVAQSISAS